MITKNRSQENVVTYGQMNIIFQARNLWREFVMWSRVYLISKIAGIGLAEDVFNRLYRIPLEFGDITRLIFGNQVADITVQQLSTTVVLFRQLVDAIIAGDNETAAELTQALYKNADERAKYLASINPFWDETHWKYLIYTFYNYSFQEITSILTGDPRNIELFDRFLQYADVMGDYFAQGLFSYLAYNGRTNPLPPDNSVTDRGGEI
jgi:hypothetical protein